QAAGRAVLQTGSISVRLVRSAFRAMVRRALQASLWYRPLGGRYGAMQRVWRHCPCQIPYQSCFQATRPGRAGVSRAMSKAVLVGVLVHQAFQLALIAELDLE